MQPGPIYFLTPRKCSVFGVNCEAIPRQINFLTDEAGEAGRGANAVISWLHFFLENHGLGERDAYFHADNCTGQNKNNTVIAYFMWRILTKRHTNITYSFLVVGHTKFSPDWCFGLFKRLYRRTPVSCLADVAAVVNRSAICNTAQLVCTEDGSELVTTYDWTSFFASHMHKIQGIKKYHHFRFASASPGIVFAKNYADTDEIPFSLLKSSWQPDPGVLPARIQPKGLSEERQWYLHDSIRQFCSEEHRDTVCPLPAHPKQKRRCTPAPV